MCVAKHTCQPIRQPQKRRAYLWNAVSHCETLVRPCCPAVPLQGKLTALEDAHAALSASYKESQAALEQSRGEAGRLGREAGQLAAVVEKLEDRCALL
jgi:hypothetical protein